MKKLLLMGSSGAGKTSMHSVIFANFPAKDTAKIGYTVEKQQHKFKLMDTLVLNLLDCGGQPTFMEQYFLVQRETIFRGVQVLIYVFDIEDKGQKLAKSLQYWGLTLQSVQHYNENAKIFVLIHKIDKLPNDERKLMIESKKQEIQSITELKKIKVTNFFATSIWDETLYQAWSKIVQSLIPNHDFINQTLKQLCLTCHVNQAVLFERSTFLILSYYNNQNNGDMLTYEKIANIIKQFKLTCSKYGGNIELIQVNTSSFTGIIQQFTKSENILVINQNKNQNIRSQLLQLNITNLGKYFKIKRNQFIQKENT